MNLVPHVHKIDIATTFRGSYVVYGDTWVKIRKFFWESDIKYWSQDKMERRITPAAKQAIRVHDEGTKKEARRGDVLAAARAVGTDLKIQETPAEVWPSEILDRQRKSV